MPPASPDSSAPSTVVYATGVVQGIVLVTFPAASAILTAKSGYGLSPTQYGLMFLPQVVAAIAASLAGGTLGTRFGSKRVYQAGLVAGLVAMVVLFASQFVESERVVAYPMLLVATGFVGAGFGLTVPTLNTLTAAFHPRAVDRSTLVLNALLGLGTALAPVFVAVFVGLGFWWGLPLLSAVILVTLLGFSAPLALRAATTDTSATRRGALPARFWLFGAIALLYGLIETMSGNWSGSFISADLGGSATAASLALTAFWASVTVGRILFAVIQRALPSRWIYRFIPVLVALAYLGVAFVRNETALGGILEFALAGLGCSALLPLTISLGEEQFNSVPVSGRLIAVYQAGYGVAAFAVGPLVSGGLTLGAVFGGAAVLAVVLAVLAGAATRRGAGRPSAAS